ncbi:ribosome silencing factor [Olsenella porci]|uniref:Ribosomal silencing factor RsfS n=1 Tax=Olsenella porci TaxID=2652279 RepID=A0A6N7XG04_9ACTN|nr:ribosome silencing factor [Olsenella porci]MST73213.1 ribosome silencing factor [Olsenella porci]
MTVTPLQLAKVAAASADGKKAADIVLLDLSQVSDICDYFLICTAQNKPQMDAILDGIEEKVRVNCDERPLSMEGRGGSDWVLLDYGSVVVHVFKPEARDFYRLESLWGEAPRVDLGLSVSKGEPASEE